MILLCTLNARYIHSALGLRYLYANMGDLQPQTELREFMINQRPTDIAEQILELDPAIVGLGCYIWNIQKTAEVIAVLKALRPEITIVLGGPEISYESEQSPAWPWADHIICGQADFAFADLCRQLVSQQAGIPKLIQAASPSPQDIKLPYRHYNEEDIRQRVIYVEASRGCPFKCEFCLSALDRTALPFDLDLFFEAMEDLYLRGARHFKFVDRTFNLNVETSKRILQFFLDKPLHDLFLHFELIPDRLPEALKNLIEQFPAGSLQFEIGIQSFNPEVQQLISRRQDDAKTAANLRYLNEKTGIHCHTDLIAGLPGEDIDSFARGFDHLVSLGAEEIQLGILKRLRGTPITRHTQDFQMVYNPIPPYEILSTRDMNAETLFRMKRFARYWDMIANSGRFSHSLAHLLEDRPFENFMQLSDWLYRETGQTHKIALPRLFRLLHDFKGQENFTDLLQKDYALSGIKGPFTNIIDASVERKSASPTAATRQLRHVKR